MSKRIAILVEGATETAFKLALQTFLRSRMPTGEMPRLDLFPFDGRIPTGEKLKRIVENLLNDRRQSADAVIALTDVYTGTREFSDAQDAKQKMRNWVGGEPRFFPHVALHDFEAWLLPYWPRIQKLAGSDRTMPGTHPEQVNHGKPPAHRLREVFRTGDKGKAYIKPIGAAAILRDQDLTVAANACPELKSFLNTILDVCGGARLL